MGPTDSLKNGRIPLPARNLTLFRNIVLAFLSFLASRNTDLVGNDLITSSNRILTHVYEHIWSVIGNLFFILHFHNLVACRNVYAGL